MKDKMWETIADLSAHIQVANDRIFFYRRYTFLDFLQNSGWPHTFGTHCNYEKYF
jgi:hypothetical protein